MMKRLLLLEKEKEEAERKLLEKDEEVEALKKGKEEAEKGKEEAEKGKEEAEKELEKRSKTLLKNGFPTLDLVAQKSSSGTSVNYTHPPAKFNEAKFEISKTQLNDTGTSLIWAMAMKKRDQTLTFGNEQEIAACETCVG